MNKPVAHFYPEGEGCTVYDIQFAWKVTGTTEPIPLYTHPVNPKYDPETGEPLIDGYPLFSGLPHPVKELTDEEIGDFEYQIIRACGLSTANSDINPIGLRQIIKAILRKAQEK